jgi:hypothetical protein
MSTPGSKLRLGALPHQQFVKLNITVSTDTKALLDRYAVLHSKLYGESVDAVALIPHMLQAFMERDRGFKSMALKTTSSQYDG